MLFQRDVFLSVDDVRIKILTKTYFVDSVLKLVSQIRNKVGIITNNLMSISDRWKQLVNKRNNNNEKSLWR